VQHDHVHAVALEEAPPVQHLPQAGAAIGMGSPSHEGLPSAGQEPRLPASLRDGVPEPVPAAGVGAAALAAGLLAACGGGGGDGASSSPDSAPGTGGTAAPAPPPPPPSRRDAARFLSQASFGPRSVEEIDAVREQGYAAWLERQFSAPTLGHVAYLEQERSRDDNNKVRDEMSYEAVWQQWLTGEDPLRSRMSWALLQIFVISNIAPDLRPHAMSSYLDLLNQHAFGTYRQLLEAVTLHPAMGYYLNMVESEKEDPKRGTHPNENYAREVLQLFSIGLYKLNADGSAQFGADGKLAPSYDEGVIRGFAQAFSGWSYGGSDTSVAKNFHRYDANNETLWQTPMKPWAVYHETAPKTLLDGRVLPANQTAEKDLKDALDTIANHPNVGPFIGRQLIQRLVTSNPSPAYLARVSAAFANNGQGQRGDLKAVLRAVLLDEEARSDAGLSNPAFGKLREPMLRFIQWARLFKASSVSTDWNVGNTSDPGTRLGQSPQRSGSVFNYFRPGYVPPNTALAAQALVAPEFQITNESSVGGGLNYRQTAIGKGHADIRANHAAELALAGNPPALVDRLNLLLCAGQLGSETRTLIINTLSGMAATTDNDKANRVYAAVLLVMACPDYLAQR